MAKRKRAKKARKGDACNPKVTSIKRDRVRHAYNLCRCTSTGKFTKKPACKLAYKK